MKQGTHFITVVTVLLGTVLFAPLLQARTCSGNGDVIGSYGFAGSRSGFFLLGATAPGSTLTPGPLVPVGVTPPGSTATVTGSNTPIGTLFAGLSNRNVFSAVGRVFADGMGNLYAGGSVGSLTMNTLVGTYNVTTDCGVTMKLSDPFVPGNIIGGPATGAAVTLEGEIADSANANEIDMIATGANAAGAVVTFTRTSQFNSCSNASLAGNFAVVAEGMFNATAGTGIGGTGGIGGTTGTTITGATGTGGAFTSGVTGTLGTPFALLGRFVADGSGNLITDISGTTAPLKRNLTGTYLVNVDCTGTAHLTDAVSGVTRNISFVLVNESAACSAGANVSTSIRQKLDFVFSDPGVIGSGTARQQ